MTQPLGSSPTPSVGMLVTGGVGGWLLLGAYAGCALLMTFTVASRGDFHDAMIVGMFGVLIGLAWMGGVVCQIVGWFGLGRVYAGAYRAAAVTTIIEVSLLVTLPVLFALTMEPDLWPIYGWLSLGVVTVTNVVSAFALWSGRAAPGVARAAAVGFIMAGLASVTVALMLLDGGTPDEGVAMIVMLMAAAGFGLGHFGAGVVMLRARQHATVVEALS